jgi:hypothetical protein
MALRHVLPMQMECCVVSDAPPDGPQTLNSYSTLSPRSPFLELLRRYRRSLLTE